MSERTTQERPYEIVVGFDFSELAERAFEEALSIAARHTNSELHVVSVADSEGTLVCLPGETKPLSDQEAQEKLRVRVAQMTDSYGSRKGPVKLERVGVYVLSSIPAPEPGRLIVQLAESVDADVIVVGTHGRRGIKRLVFGSVAQQVVRDASTSVLVVRPSDMIDGKRVPAIEAPLPEGAPHLRPFEHRRIYHYVDRVSHWTDRMLPVS